MSAHAGWSYYTSVRYTETREWSPQAPRLLFIFPYFWSVLQKFLKIFIIYARRPDSHIRPSFCFFFPQACYLKTDSIPKFYIPPAECAWDNIDRGKSKVFGENKLSQWHCIICRSQEVCPLIAYESPCWKVNNRSLNSQYGFLSFTP